MLGASSTTHSTFWSRWGSRQNPYKLAVRDVIADAAQAQLVILLHIQQGSRQLLGVLARRAQDVERQPLR